MPDHQIALHQQFQRVVDGCATHIYILRLQTDKKFISVKVVVACVDFIEYFEALGCLPEIFFLQKVRKNRSNVFELFW